MLKIGGEIDGENKKVLPAIDTSTEAIAFGPSTKRKLFYEVNKENNVKLLVNKQLASERSTSFIFMSDTLELFTQQETHSTYLEVLLELNYFGRRYLAVVNTKSMAAIRSNVMLPLYTLNACDALVINTVGTNIIEIPELKQVLDIELSKEEYEEIHKNLTKIKEKCRTSNNDNCNKCLLSHERSCLMKVFATHHSYRPSPHNGDEFGDVSFPVTIDGHTVTLVGVIKAAPHN